MFMEYFARDPKYSRFHEQTKGKKMEFILRASFTLQETRSIHDSMNIPKMEFIS